MSNSKLNATDDDRSFLLCPGNVLLVQDANAASIAPCPIHNDEVVFPHSLPLRNNCKRVYKCYDYRMHTDLEVVQEGDQRSHTLYKDRVFDFQLEADIGTSPNKLVIISYEYLKGTHVPTHVSQLLAIFHFVIGMHEDGICHGDIRLRNCVFADVSMDSLNAGEKRVDDVEELAGGISHLCTPTKKVCNPVTAHNKRYAVLIDFDFSGKASERRYPAGFRREIKDGKRHEDAQQGQLLAPHHDIFALASVWDLFCIEDSSANVIWAGVIQHLYGGKPDNVEEMLKNIVNCTVILKDA